MSLTNLGAFYAHQGRNAEAEAISQTFPQDVLRMAFGPDKSAIGKAPLHSLIAVLRSDWPT